MSIHKWCFVIAGFMIAINLQAQNFKDPMTGVTNRIYVQYTDSLVETFYYRGEKKIKTNDELFYYWYAAQDIKHTRGAYEGKILHGSYTMFYYNKDLLAKGNFKYGLKDGEWKSWHAGGELKSKEKWKKGKIVGTSYYYNLQGRIQKVRKLSQSGNGYVMYYNDKGILSAKEYYKDNSLEKKIQYETNKRGKAVVIKPEKNKTNKKTSEGNQKSSLNPFKKKAPKEEKKVKQKKTKSPKIKIQKYRQIVPGGQGA